MQLVWYKFTPGIRDHSTRAVVLKMLWLSHQSIPVITFSNVLVFLPLFLLLLTNHYLAKSLPLPDVMMKRIQLSVVLMLHLISLLKIIRYLLKIIRYLECKNWSTCQTLSVAEEIIYKCFFCVKICLSIYNNFWSVLKTTERSNENYVWIKKSIYSCFMDIKYLGICPENWHLSGCLRRHWLVKNTLRNRM